MEHMKISFLYLGRLEFLKKHQISCGNDSEKFQCLIPAILIQHPTLGNILYDTGCTPLYSTEHPKVMLENYPVTEFISIEQALTEKGLKPSDIDILILSHLHFDHSGGLKYFAGTKAIKNVIISEADLKEAYYEVMSGKGHAYSRPLFDVNGIQFQPIEDTYSLSDEITLFTQRCHTPGVIGLILKTQNYGTIIVTSDTIYTRENYEKRTPPGGDNSASQKDFFVNLEQIKALKEKHDAYIFFGHDEVQIKEWCKKGWID